MRRHLLVIVMLTLVLFTGGYGQVPDNLPPQAAQAAGSVTEVAAIPSKMSYQGILQTSSGSPAQDGDYELKFELFNVANAGSPLWTETQSGVRLDRGTFSVLLGSVTPLTGIFYQPLWVEITALSGPGIGSPVLFSPRTELASVPYALGPWQSAGTDIYFNGGNVGIGTGLPLTKLHIKDALSTPVLKIEGPVNSSNDGPAVRWTETYTSDYGIEAIMDGGNDALVFRGIENNSVVNDSLFAIRPYYQGRVGVNTLYPTRLLDVNGDMHVADTLSVGSSGKTGAIKTYMSGSGNPVVSVENYTSHGGTAIISDEEGNMVGRIRPSSMGTGGTLELFRNTAGSLGIYAGGNNFGDEEGYFQVYGSARSAVIYMGSEGNSSVQLPDASISSDEIMNEPGIAQQTLSTIINLPGITMTDIDTISVTIPAPGYIMLEASSFAWLYGTTGQNQVYAQIDETQGGTIVSPHWTKAGLGSYATTAGNFFQLFCTRTYFKNAGTYSFRFEACQVGSNGSGASSNVYISQLRAVYYPTSYGEVSSSASEAEFSQFESLNPETKITDESSETSQTETVYNVDLRDLELKALKARAEADRAERELLEAKLTDQNIRIKNEQR